MFRFFVVFVLLSLISSRACLSTTFYLGYMSVRSQVKDTWPSFIGSICICDTWWLIWIHSTDIESHMCQLLNAPNRPLFTLIFIVNLYNTNQFVFTILNGMEVIILYGDAHCSHSEWIVTETMLRVTWLYTSKWASWSEHCLKLTFVKKQYSFVPMFSWYFAQNSFPILLCPLQGRKGHSAFTLAFLDMLDTCVRIVLNMLVYFAVGNCHRLPRATAPGSKCGWYGWTGRSHQNYVLHHGRRGHFPICLGCDW